MRRLLVAMLLLPIAAPALAKPPSWDRRIDSPKRFKVLKEFDSEAVLDQETGLVWQRDPELDTYNWVTAFDVCVLAGTGGRSGWRLPTISELRSLIDIPRQALPEGHPFLLNFITPAVFWSATTSANFPDLAYIGDAQASDGQISQANKLEPNLAWCVRGMGGGRDSL